MALAPRAQPGKGVRPTSADQRRIASAGDDLVGWHRAGQLRFVQQRRDGHYRSLIQSGPIYTLAVHWGWIRAR